MANNKKVIFAGVFTSTVDSKKRVCMPARWKSVMIDEVYIKKGFDGCLEVRSIDDFQEYAEKFIAANSEEQDNRVLKRFALGNSQALHIDSWGRFVIPSNWLDAAKISKEISLVGNGNYIEIWDTNLYNTFIANNAEKVNDMKIIRQGHAI